MTDLELLQIFAKEIKPAQLKSPVIPRRIVFLRDNQLYVTARGFLALSDLARSIQQNQPMLRRGAKFENVRNVAERRAVRLFAKQVKAGSIEVSESHLRTLKKEIAEWFAEETSAPRHHVVPCAVIPSYAKQFCIGPVKFQHICDFDQQQLGITKDHPAIPRLWTPLFEPQMSSQAATWTAEVDINGCDEKRSREIADVLVDIALASLQIAIGPSHARYMARSTSRANPPYRGDLVIQSGQIQTHVCNMEAGPHATGRRS